MRNEGLGGERVRAVLGAVGPLVAGDALGDEVEVAERAAFDAARRLDEPEDNLVALAQRVVREANLARL